MNYNVMMHLSFLVNNYKVDSAVFSPPEVKEKNPAILFLHWWTSNKERNYRYAEVLVKLGFICFLFDMRGHGKSEGDIKSFTIRNFFEDVLAAYDRLVKIGGVDPDGISVIGSSFGGYLAALLSKQRKIKNISLRVPADYADDEFDELKYKSSGFNNPEIMKWRSTRRSPGDTMALRAVHEFDGNIQIIESEKDIIVPRQIIQNYIDAVIDKDKLSYTVIQDAPHSAKEQWHRDEIEKLLADWFGKMVS